jgi:hypothetical protein
MRITHAHHPCARPMRTTYAHGHATSRIRPQRRAISARVGLNMKVRRRTRPLVVRHRFGPADVPRGTYWPLRAWGQWAAAFLRNPPSSIGRGFGGRARRLSSPSSGRPSPSFTASASYSSGLATDRANCSTWNLGGSTSLYVSNRPPPTVPMRCRAVSWSSVHQKSAASLAHQRPPLRLATTVKFILGGNRTVAS